MALTVEQLIERLKKVSGVAKEAVVYDPNSGDAYSISRVEEEEGGDEVRIILEDYPKL